MNVSYCISNRTFRKIELNTLLMPKANKSEVFIISALRARANFGKLLSRVENDRHSLIIEERGTPRAVLLGLQDYLRLAAPEPEVLRLIGEESEASGTSALTSREIEKIIKTARAVRAKKSQRL
jgi:prevent-host-death family protein